MDSLLFSVKDFIEQLVATHKSIIDFDMYVTDENLCRIAGTGEYKRYVGYNMPSGCASDYVLKTGKPVTIFNPLEHFICEKCPIKQICIKEYMIIYPIRESKKTMGIISISAISPEDKIRMKNLESNLYAYLENLADSITAKVKEKIYSERLTKILNSVDEGILLTDRNGNILLYNEIARKMLNDIDSYENIANILPNHDIDSIIKSGEAFKYREFNFYDYNGDKRLFVSLIQIQHNTGTPEILFLFKDQKSMSSIAYNLLADYSYFPINLNNIIGISGVINQAKETARNASKSDSNVLIYGESGTGKELFARSIHQMSNRCKKPFIAINCAAIPDNLLESELFGYEDGAFTGAKKGGKPGKFELANGGTIFLDEIGDLSLHLQPKLLRAIERGEIERVGGIKPIKLDVRIIAATNRDLEKMMKNGEFREDLYYRLSVIPLYIPPLRKRLEDIIIIAKHFLNVYNSRFSKNITGFSEQVEKALLIYDWPGNVRELENAIEYAVNVEQSEIITIKSLPPKFANISQLNVNNSTNMSLQEMEKKAILDLLLKNGNTVKGKEQTARELGISLSTLYRRLRLLD